jgi:D-glycero-D-manno-heptose 1,7-bisphosphate phosphatase
MKQAAVFLDKDGTLVRDVPFNVDPDLIELTPGAGEAVEKLKRAGFRIFVVSNQSGVGRGLFAEDDLAAVWARLDELCAAGIDGFYFCPHLPAAGCRCRKPAAGMLERAAAENGLELARSWLVGDILDDVEAGRRAGCRTILLDVGSETEWLTNEARTPHYTATDLTEAAEIILSNE